MKQSFMSDGVILSNKIEMEILIRHWYIDVDDNRNLSILVYILHCIIVVNPIVGRWYQPQLIVKDG